MHALLGYVAGLAYSELSSTLSVNGRILALVSRLVSKPGPDALARCKKGCASAEGQPNFDIFKDIQSYRSFLTHWGASRAFRQPTGNLPRSCSHCSLVLG